MSGCKSKKRLVPVISAWLLLITCTALFFLFPCQYLQNTYSIAITIVQAIISLFVITNFSYATFMDPGVIPKASPDEDVRDDFRAPLFKSVDINGLSIRMKWCCTCQFYRPPRCSHCSVCNHCVEIFDHHCPWVNNCISRRNYRHFFFFLVFLSIHMITIFIWCTLYLLDHRSALREPDSIISFFISGVILLLIIPIIGLTGFHIILVARGRTTNEQVTGKFQNYHNPFSKGCLANYCYILCGPVHTRYRPTRRKQKCSSTSNDCKPFQGTNTYDKSMQIYVDESNKLLYAKSPVKSSSVTEISSQSFSPCLRHQSLNDSQGGGLVIYYSPDVYTKKSEPSLRFSSDTEIQKLHHVSFNSISIRRTDGSFDKKSLNSNSGKSISNANLSFAKRPINFIKALETSNIREKTRSSLPISSPVDTFSKDSRNGQYEKNYEISV